MYVIEICIYAHKCMYNLYEKVDIYPKSVLAETNACKYAVNIRHCVKYR